MHLIKIARRTIFSFLCVLISLIYVSNLISLSKNFMKFFAVSRCQINWLLFFRSLQCPRVHIHKNVIISLIMKCVINIIIFEPYVTLSTTDSVEEMRREASRTSYIDYVSNTYKITHPSTSADHIGCILFCVIIVLL